MCVWERVCVCVCVCVSGSFSLGDGNFCERQRLPIATAFIVKLILGIQHTHTQAPRRPFSIFRHFPGTRSPGLHTHIYSGSVKHSHSHPPTLWRPHPRCVEAPNDFKSISFSGGTYSVSAPPHAEMWWTWMLGFLDSIMLLLAFKGIRFPLSGAGEELLLLPVCVQLVSEASKDTAL